MNQREMAKDETQTIYESSPKLFDNGIRTAAIGTLEITVGHQGDRRRIRSGDMVIVLDGKHRIGIDRWFAHPFVPRARDHCSLIILIRA